MTVRHRRPAVKTSASYALTEGTKTAVARAIAEVVPREALAADYVIPRVFNKRVAPRVAAAVVEAARADGVARQ